MGNPSMAAQSGLKTSVFSHTRYFPGDVLSGKITRLQLTKADLSFTEYEFPQT